MGFRDRDLDDGNCTGRISAGFFWAVGGATAVLSAGIAQFIVGLYAFRRANALNATAFTSFGAFNTTLGTMLLLEVVGAVSPQSGSHEMLGFLLELFAFVALGLAFAALRRNLVLLCLLATLCIGYALTGVSQFMLTPANAARAGGAVLGPVAAAGGALLLASSFFAYYLGLTLLVNSTRNCLVLPIAGEP